MAREQYTASRKHPAVGCITQHGSGSGARRKRSGVNGRLVACSEERGILTVAFDRPDKLNALNDEMTLALQAALAVASRDERVRVVILQGNGRGFSVGQDLEVFGSRYESGEPIDIADHLRRGYNRVVAQIRALEKPVIASIGGVTAGVGLSIALACDIRIASESATFTLGFSRIGLIPDGGASFMLPLLAGLGRAYELAATSDRIDAAEAHRLGLVNRVVCADELDDAVRAFAQKLAALPAGGLALTKRAFNRAVMPGFEAWLEEECCLQQRASETADHREGVVAFLAKRPPVFTGR